MARPAGRNTWAQALTAWPSPGGAAYRPRASRAQKTAILLLSIVFGLLLVAAMITAVVLISQLSAPASPASRPAGQPAASQNLLAGVPLASGQTRILLLGSDQRPGDNGYRTDTIMLVVIDSDLKTVSIVSFPRDLWVEVPSLYEMKINQVQALGGFEATAGLFQANFGVRPDYYVLTNFDGFTRFIDQLGGVQVDVGQDLSDECSLPVAVNSQCSVNKGSVAMDGKTALWYVRSRHSSNDYDRLRRAQEVVYAVFKKLMNNFSLDKLTEIKAALENNIETNFAFDNALAFLPVALNVLQNPEAIKCFAIDEKEATPSWSWNGMWILLPDQEAIQGVLEQAGIKP